MLEPNNNPLIIIIYIRISDKDVSYQIFGIVNSYHTARMSDI